MKKKLLKSLSLILLLGFITSIARNYVFAATKTGTDTTSAIEDQAMFILQEPTDLETLKNSFNNSDIKINFISNMENVNSNIYTGFYLIPNDIGFDEMCKDFSHEYLQGLNELITQFEIQASQATDPTYKKSIDKLLKDTIQRKEKISKGIKPKIASISVKGTKNAIENEFKSKKNLFKDIKFKTSKNHIKPKENTNISTLIDPRLSVSSSTLPWVPNLGRVNTAVASWDNTKVYMYNSFWWSSDANLAGLRQDTNKTFEGEVYFYNFDGKGFAKNWGFEDPNNTQRGLYWDTNQPRAYWDTQASDGLDERCFTIGCSDANLIKSSQLYYWSGTAAKNSSGSSSKLVMQRGHRTPSDFYENTWAIFSDESIKVVNYTDYTAPGEYSWSR